jgi:hypothetical protein
MYCVGVARRRREVKIRCSDVEALWDYLLSALARNRASVSTKHRRLLRFFDKFTSKSRRLHLTVQRYVPSGLTLYDLTYTHS